MTVASLGYVLVTSHSQVNNTLQHSKMADIQKVDPVMEKPWQRARRFERYDLYNKSAYPPMQIEPLPYERNRLAQPMTTEQRALRKQWVKDQTLHSEPRFIPEVKPFNIFRRIYRWPADVLLYEPVKKIFGTQTAILTRYTLPKIIMAIGGGYFAWYQLKYNQNDWTRSGGVMMYEGKPQFFGKGEPLPDKEATDYFDRGFKSRKTLTYK